MRLGLDHPLALLLIAGCVLPLLGYWAHWRGQASLCLIPRDRWSDLLEAGLRLLAALPVAAIAFGLAGLHQRQIEVPRVGRGAHIVVALDRSLSMDEPFALRGEKAAESKTAAAARMIGALFARREQDRFALVAFSTAPILAMPLTDHRAALAAAIGAMRGRAVGNTDIGAGLAMALWVLAHDPPGAVPVILLVSDGAGDIPGPVRLYLQQEVARLRPHLYYLYLRAGDDPPLAGTGGDDANMMHPAVLDAYLRGLGIPYAAFEARDADAVAAATRRISALETHPLAYRETLPRHDLDRWCYALALICLALSLAAQLAERDAVSAA